MPNHLQQLALRAIFGLYILCLPVSLPAYEDVLPRYALVLGNANYKFSPLKNSVNDARDMAASLRKLRYKVTLLTDKNPEQMREGIYNFFENVKEPDAITLVYYAGHAVQADNVNYLLPVNAGITSFEKLKQVSFSINELFRVLKHSRSKQNVIILDACRNNPFKASAPGSQGRSVILGDSQLTSLADGLAPVEAPRNTLIAYATEPGNTASDGKGRNGAYTSALLHHISRSETAEVLFKKVRKEVLRSTRYKQTPWEHSSLTEKFYFMPPSNEEIPDIIGF
ncbi:MAG: caspase family protein [Gammaproteobacteria bacterium]|nr:caspase family protein [Gammaproteobacteria bacterium]